VARWHEREARVRVSEAARMPGWARRHDSEVGERRCERYVREGEVPGQVARMTGVVRRHAGEERARACALI
jgi:hypothetical protein